MPTLKESLYIRIIQDLQDLRNMQDNIMDEIKHELPLVSMKALFEEYQRSQK